MYDPRYDYPPDPSTLAPTQPIYNAQGMESIVQKHLHQQQHLYYSHALQSMGLHDMLHGEAYAARNSPLSYGAPLNIPALPLPSRQDGVPEATHPHTYQLQEQGYTPRIRGPGAPSLSTGLPMSAIDDPQSYFIPLVLTHVPTQSPDSWEHTPPSMLSSPLTLTSSPDSLWDSDIVGQPSPPWPTFGEVVNHHFVAKTPTLPSRSGNFENPRVPVAAAASGRVVLTTMQLGLSTPQAKIEAARRSQPPQSRLIGPTGAGLDHQNIRLDRAQGPHVPREAQDARPAGTDLNFVVGSQLLAIQGSIPTESDSIPSSTSMLNSVGLAVQRDKNTITPIAPQINPWVGVPAAVSQTRPSSVQQVATGRVPAARNRARYNPVAGSSSLPATTPRLAKAAPAVATSSTPPPTTQATSNLTALGRQSFNAPWHGDTKMRKLAVAGDYLRSLAPDEYIAPDGTFFCPFAHCSQQASGIATELNLLWHIVRCGDPTQCKLCNKKIERGHSSYEMHRHRRGGMGRGVKGTSKRNDCRVPCTYIKGNCGTVDGDTRTIYNHMVEDGILDSVIDDPQLGYKTDMLSRSGRATRPLTRKRRRGELQCEFEGQGRWRSVVYVRSRFHTKHESALDKKLASDVRGPHAQNAVVRDTEVRWTGTICGGER